MLKIQIKMYSDMEGIYFISLEKNFKTSKPGPHGFPQTSTEAIKRVIEKLKEMIKEEDVKQCYTCDHLIVPSGKCKEQNTFKESHDTCPLWILMEKN